MKRILIANRGEIARRIIRTAHAMGVETVAVYSEPDAGALHVREATCAFALGGVTSADSYLRMDRLLEAARATGADAVHPGYGFLSEDAGFAEAVRDAGLVWIGPPPEAIRALGSKSAAKALATSQGVPCLPGYAGADQSDERFAAEAGRVGYPLMVKAVAGGGGRGMRLVHEPAQLPAALASARSEALASFGNGELLIEQALLNPRHVEVQVFADMHGACIHLGERDCSVQRRHQKIIEEAPSPAVDAALRERMGQCAVALARGAGYVGAGTVEFLLDGDGFFLMEMNTRLQVEHPVTEALTGLDLVEWQIRVARGEPLPLAQHEVQFKGHAIEVRLCAEDENFIPHTGRVLHFSGPAATQFGITSPGSRAATGPRLRFDHAIEAGLEVTPHYDAMLGKLIVHAATREAAIDGLVQALGQTELLGFPTNRAFLAACLDHPQFRAGRALVSFLASEVDTVRESLLKEEQKMAIKYGLAAVFSPKTALHSLPCPFSRPLRLRHRDTISALQVRDLGAGQWLLQSLDGVALPDEPIHLANLPDGAVQCTQGDVARRVRAAQLGEQRWHLQAGAVDWWLEDLSLRAIASAGTDKNSNELRAPFNGRVVSVAAVPGQALAAGDTAVVIESMKLEHSLAGTMAASVAEVLVSPGQQVSPGQVLVRFSKEEDAA
jgi:geranyl-CoA carboxylase alpha subunit